MTTSNEPTPAYDHGVASYPGTKIRGVRVADDIWRAAHARAQADGTTVSAVLVAYLDAYGQGHDTPQPVHADRLTIAYSDGTESTIDLR